MATLKIRYDLLKPDGTTEYWTGEFKTEEKAFKWYMKHGKEWESKGLKFKKIYVG